MTSTSRRTILFVILLALGAAACYGFVRTFGYEPNFLPTSWRAITLYGIAALTLVCLPGPRDAAMHFIDRLNDEHLTSRRWLAVFVFIGIALYFYTNGLLHERDLTPRFHDENSYHIQAQMMARGRLWMPPFPDGLGDFFESFHILVKPVYASIYFPGTAMLYVPGAWVGAPTWVTSILLNALTGTVLFLVAARLLKSNAYGLLAAIMFIATPRIRWSSAAVFSHPAAMLAGLLVIWTWLNWREEKRLGTAMALGAAIGWSAIVRPFDLLAYGIPIGIVFLFELRRLRIGQIAMTFVAIALAAAPFLALQLILNRGTTGDPFTTPYRAYIDQFQPGSQLGFHPVLGVRPQTALPQKIDLYDRFALPQLQAHRIDNIGHFLLRDRVPFTVSAIVPTVLCVVFLPLGLVAAFSERTRLAIATVPWLFMGLYLFNPYFVGHYPMVVAPAAILTVLFALDALDGVLSRVSLSMIGVPLILTLAMTLPGIPELALNFDGREPDDMPELGGVNQHLAEPAFRRSLVFFRFLPGGYVHAEPVYNTDAPWPFDAQAIRAHDLGPERDAQLIEYVAARDPNRMVYLVVREPTTNVLIKLGRAADWSKWYATSPLGNRDAAATTRMTTQAPKPSPRS